MIPGKKSPVLLYKETVAQMKPNSVIVDLAIARGGNCEVTEMDQTILYNGVIVIGEKNMAGKIAATASELYSNNVAQLVKLLCTSSMDEIVLDANDEIIQKTILCHQGKPYPFLEKEKAG